jgi:hypothetical protein
MYFTVEQQYEYLFFFVFKVKVWFQNRRMKWRHMQQIRDKELSDRKIESEDQSDKLKDNESKEESNQDT